jgi:hypothetical protein
VDDTRGRRVSRRRPLAAGYPRKGSRMDITGIIWDMLIAPVEGALPSG